MPDHGLFVNGCRYPIATGTRKECRARVNELRPDQLLRGWTVAPVPEHLGALPTRSKANPAWVVLGASLLAAVVSILYFAAQGATR